MHADNSITYFQVFMLNNIFVQAACVIQNTINITLKL